jgi:hypothetical protein
LAVFRRKLKPSEVLIRYLDGTGGGRELDDYLSGRMSADEQRMFLEPLLQISQKHARGLKPGLLNEDARDEIRALADQLKADGL